MVVFSVGRSGRVRRLGLLLVLSVFASVSQASLIQLDFDVQASERQTLNDGNYLADWEADTDFSGRDFSLAIGLDPSSVVSGSERFGRAYTHTLTVPLFAFSSPFESEMDAVMTRWPGLGVGDASLTFVQRLNGNTDLAQIVVQITQSTGLVGNTPDILDSTEQAQRFTSLIVVGPSDQFQTPVLTTAEVVGGALLELQDFIAYISQPSVQFNFTQISAQSEGTYESVFFGGSVGQGLQYRGTASFSGIREMPSPAPVPGSIWLFGAALCLLMRQRCTRPRFWRSSFS